MDSDTAHLRSDAIRLVTIATGVMGFGLFNAPVLEFKASGGIFNAATGVVGFFLGKPADLPPGVLLDWLRFGLISWGFILYAATIVSAGLILVRDGLNARDLRSPYLAMAGTILMVSLLFIASIVDRGINQRPSVDIAGFAAPTCPA